MLSTLFSCPLVSRPLARRSFALALVASFASAGLLAATGAGHAQSAPPFELVLENDVFTPADLRVPANKPFTLRVINKEKVAVEIESKALKIEKIVAAGGEVVTHVRPQKAGKYLLVNEFKEETVKTFIIVE